ncbi:hypothetical protein LCGC14_1117900 [marine sediment metagenome]
MKTKAIHVLLIDDDEDDRMFFEEVLESLDLVTDFNYAENGSKAIEWLQGLAGKLPDIIFLDLNMPLMSGSECLEYIRGDYRYRDITIIIYSTSYDSGSAAVLRGLGADRYIRKPPTFEGLKRVISAALGIFGRNGNRANTDGEFLIHP